MPLIGFGTYRLKGEAVADPLRAALAAGYKHIDTASIYKNEQVIGDIIRDYIKNNENADWEHIFITTKLTPKDQGFEKASIAIDQSIEKLGISPIDLFLIHWPGIAGRKVDDPETASIRLGTWRALEKALIDGKVRSIGESNIQPRHLIHLLENAKIVPHVNQIELHPACPQTDLMELCKKNNIQIVAYSSVGVGELLDHHIVLDIAKRFGRTPAQILLRWGLQKGVCVIPKASSKERIEENHKVVEFELDVDAMNALDNIAQEYSTPKHFCWDPETIKF